MKVKFIKTHVAVEWKGDTRNHFNTTDGKIPDLTINYDPSTQLFTATDGIEEIHVPSANVPYFKELKEVQAKKKVNER